MPAAIVLGLVLNLRVFSVWAPPPAFSPLTTGLCAQRRHYNLHTRSLILRLKHRSAMAGGAADAAMIVDNAGSSRSVVVNSNKTPTLELVFTPTAG